MNIQTSNYNTSFNGIFTRTNNVFSPRSLSKVAGILKLSRNDVYSRTRLMSSKQYDFFEALTDRYNEMYHYSETKENPQILFNLAGIIKTPNKAHIKVLNNISGSFENLAKIFQAATSKKDLEFAQNFEKAVFNTRSHAENILTDILNSKYKDEYIQNINHYKSYLKINKDNENAIKELDKMIEEGSYSRAVYDKQRHLESFFESYPKYQTISREEISKYYTPEGVDFMENFSYNYHTPAYFSDKAREDLLDMYKTCNRKNISMRKYILDKFSTVIYNSENFNEEISAMHSIFEKLENNKYVEKFLNKFLSNSNNVESLKALNEILEAVPADKAYIFNENLSRLVSITQPGEERVKTIQEEITNPFYENEASEYKKFIKKQSVEYGYAEPENKFDKLKTLIKNEFDKLRYSFLHKEPTAINPEPKAEEAVKTTVNDIKPETVVKPEIAKESAEVTKPVEQQAEFVELPKFEKEVVKKTYEAPEVKLVNTVLTKAQKSKIEAQEGVRKFIHEKLHPNIVAEQENLYTNRATKMRLKMLPEILASIKDTRASQRAEGIKRPKISNYDAIDLYTRIDGRNKKLVNYMLKKRNSDGTRMFSINDIMTELGKSHKRIILEHLKPAQARELYEEAYQAKLNEFGKLTPAKPAKNG